MPYYQCVAGAMVPALMFAWAWHRARGLRDFDNIVETRRVNLLIFLATVLMAALIWVGELMKLRTVSVGANAQKLTPLLPAVDKGLENYPWLYVIALFIYFV